MTIEELKQYKAKAKRQRDNWKRRAVVYRAALEMIAYGPVNGVFAIVISRDALKQAERQDGGR